MATLSRLVEANPEHAQATFDNIERALNEVLPGSDFHSRYKDGDEVGLALAVGSQNAIHFNPVYGANDPSFLATNLAEHPDAWGPIPEAFLEEATTELPKFAFFAMAKMEAMRLSHLWSSYDPDMINVDPGVVGYAGGRKMYGSYSAASGLWEVHDHLVTGVYSDDIVASLRTKRGPSTSDRFAEIFDEQFSAIQALHAGIAAEDIPHKRIGELLPHEGISGLRPLILSVPEVD